MGPGELEALRVALPGEPVYHRAARVAEPHHLGTFVERLAHGVVDGLAEYLEVQGVVDADYLRVAAAHQQAEVGELRLMRLLALLLDEVGEDVALKVVDHDYGDVEGDSHGLCERSSDEQRTQQAGAAGERYRRQFRGLDAGSRKRLADHRHDVELVGARRQLRHHSAVGLVDILARYHVGEQVAVADDRRGGVVAGRFYSKYNVCHFSFFNKLSKLSHKIHFAKNAAAVEARSGRHAAPQRSGRPRKNYRTGAPQGPGRRMRRKKGAPHPKND